MASYYRAIHLIEAVFDHRGQNHVIRENDGEADHRRNALFRKLQLSRLREEYKGLRRFVLHAKYFPGDSVFDYDVITQLDKTRKWIVDGHLARIECLVANELGVAPESLD